ncbi:ydjO [Escherichia coli]|nr:ydjO [Escherichia coli]SQN30083.1 ydjO [Escherichia coli]
MMSLWDALRMNMMISYQELVRTFPKRRLGVYDAWHSEKSENKQ